MTTRKGDTRKKGQKYQNAKAFRNDLHDKNKQAKVLNSLVIGGVCAHCKETIEWKIKYQKYKPLTAPKKWYVNPRLAQRQACSRKLSICMFTCVYVYILNETCVVYHTPLYSVLCQQKAVKRAYYTICDQCGQRQGVCAKCGRGGVDIVER